jgi:multidrug efflux pump subunit AcrA (membrane-fusion protein)
VPNPDRHFWPGQFVNVRLILATAKGAVLIPNQAAQISQQGPFVYVVKRTTPPSFAKSPWAKSKVTTSS